MKEMEIPDYVIDEVESRIIASNFKPSKATRMMAIDRTKSTVALMLSLGAEITWNKKTLSNIEEVIKEGDDQWQKDITLPRLEEVKE